MRFSTLSTWPRCRSLSAAAILLAASLGSSTVLSPRSDRTEVHLKIPDSPSGASLPHSASFQSFSFEPAFWVEFFGNANEPNKLTFDLLSRLVERGSRLLIRPGGITQDSMIYNASAYDPVRTTKPDGAVQHTTVGPGYFKSWDNFPRGTMFVSTLNFGMDKLDIAKDMAVASVQHQVGKVDFFELGNEPTHYPTSRWNHNTQAYVDQWKQWTAEIDQAVNAAMGGDWHIPRSRWWASSATTDEGGIRVRPKDIIDLGINKEQQVGRYSIHSYGLATCDPNSAKLATIDNMLNHSSLLHYADTEVYPSAKQALESKDPSDEGAKWIVGEFNSIACSGKPNVSDTFAQALWVVDTELIYAVRNASSVHLHQGATLVSQSSHQTNTAGEHGAPGFSTYSFVYPRDGSLRGEARALPSFVGLLFVAEALGDGVQVMSLHTPDGVERDGFSSYAFYEGGVLTKIAILNMKPYYEDSKSKFDVEVDLSHFTENLKAPAQLKRMSAPHVDEGKTERVTWAGQSYKNGEASGTLDIEKIGKDGKVNVRGSEAVLVFLNTTSVYGLDKHLSEDEKRPGTPAT